MGSTTLADRQESQADEEQDEQWEDGSRTVAAAFTSEHVNGGKNHDDGVLLMCEAAKCSSSAVHQSQPV